MGKASSRKKRRRDGRAADAGRLRVVVCTSPDTSLEPSLELLKAAVIYSDEVLLHSPTATLLLGLASLPSLSTSELLALVGDLAPAMGAKGERLAEQMASFDETMGPGGATATFGALLDGGSPLDLMLSGFDAGAAAGLAKMQADFGGMRAELGEVVESQVASAGVHLVLPAVEAGILSLLPFDATGNLFEGYLEALWGVVRDRRYYPLFDEEMASLVNSAVREGLLDLSPPARGRGRQAGAATGFLGRLPTFPLASIDEVIDIRAELDRPLVRFRAEMARLTSGFEVDAFDPAFDEAAESAWMSEVRPALLELDELVEEKRLLQQFGQAVPASGAIGAAGGLVAGLVSHTPLVAAAAGLGATALAGAQSMRNNRRRIQQDIQQRPYYLLHRAEELLGSR